MEIVGVIGDLKEDSVGSPVYPYVYYCLMGGNWPDPEYVVRSSAAQTAVMGSIRKGYARLRPGAPFSECGRSRMPWPTTSASRAPTPACWPYSPSLPCCSRRLAYKG